MTDLDPVWLRSFVAIAEAGSVTRASLQVHRTQSAVSTHLQQLEAAVNARLVDRTTRSLALTEEGERLLPHARRLLALQDEAHASVAPQAATAVWRVAISEYFLPARLGELLGVLRDTLPQSRIELLWASSATLQSLWRAGEVDLAIFGSAETVSGAKLLRREPLAWVASPGFAPPASLPTPLVLLGADCPVRLLALSSLARSARAHHVQLSCTGAHGAIAAIRAGWGVGCLNQSAVPPDLAVLSRRDARAWPSPGRLSFYIAAKPALNGAVQALRRFAGA